MGRQSDVRFRVIDLDPDEPYVPTDSDVYLTAFHLYTKASGVYRDRFDGNTAPERLVMDDVRFAAIRKAESADVILYERSTFEEFPDVWVADADFAEVTLPHRDFNHLAGPAPRHPQAEITALPLDPRADADFLPAAIIQAVHAQRDSIYVIHRLTLERRPAPRQAGTPGVRPCYA